MLVSMTDSNQLRISGRIDAGNAAELEKQMLETELPNGALPDTAAFLKEKIRQMGKYYTPAEQELLYKLLETAGDRLFPLLEKNY